MNKIGIWENDFNSEYGDGKIYESQAISLKEFRDEFKNKQRFKIKFILNKHYWHNKKAPKFVARLTAVDEIFEDKEEFLNGCISEELEENVVIDKKIYEYLIESLFKIQSLAYYGDCDDCNNQYEIDMLARELLDMFRSKYDNNVESKKSTIDVGSLFD